MENHLQSLYGECGVNDSVGSLVEFILDNDTSFYSLMKMFYLHLRTKFL